MSKKSILDSVQREQSMAEDRHRLLAEALREADSARLAAAMGEEAQDMSLAELESLNNLAESGALSELIELTETGELAELTESAELAENAELAESAELTEGVELSELSEITELPGDVLSQLASLTQTPLFAELAETNVAANFGQLSELSELAESGALAALAEQAGTLSELAEATETAELVEMAELAETGGLAETGRPAGDAELNCPKGDGPMDRIRKGGMNIDRCKICGGMWFDWGELEAMIGHHLGIEISAFAKDVGMKCPRCSGQMCSYMLPEEGVEMERWSTEVDQCRQCEGVWLDHAELEKIQNTQVQGQVKDEDSEKGLLKRFLGKILG